MPLTEKNQSRVRDGYLHNILINESVKSIEWLRKLYRSVFFLFLWYSVSVRVYHGDHVDFVNLIHQLWIL